MVVFISILLIIFSFSFISNSKAQNGESTEEFSVDFPFIEFSESNMIINNEESIITELPSESWNITHIEVNFTSIKKKYDLITVEDSFTSIGKIFNDGSPSTRLGRGVQIKLSNQTKIMGVYIYGFRSSSMQENASLKITGYKSGPQGPLPNESITYHSQNVYLESIPNWYFQNFTTPLVLSPGNYYLLINNPLIPEDPTGNDYYAWFYNNNDNPIDPTLYHAEQGRTGVWYTIGQLKPLLYKLLIQSNVSYYPETINMTARVEDSYYNVLNETEVGKGFLNISSIDVSPNEMNFEIPIYTNISDEIVFNAIYYMKINNQNIASCFLKVSNNSNNLWTISHTINKDSNNYSMKFYYPKSWNILNVLLNEESITSNVTINEIEKFILIPNNTISNLDFLNIRANSPNNLINLDVPKLDFESSEDIEFTVDTSNLNGYIKVKLYDSFGYLKYNETKIISEMSTSFFYTLSSNPHEGIWNAYIYWHNQSDAGMESLLLNITKSQITNNINGIPPNMLFLIFLCAGIISSTSFVSVKVIKNHRLNQEKSKQEKFNKFKDTLSINYIMVSIKDVGLNVYEHYFKGIYLEPTLISGFLQAIRSFGIELTGSALHVQTIKLEFQNSIIIMSEFKEFRIIFIMDENPSISFVQALELLSESISEQFGTFIKNFNGDVADFNGIEDLFEKYLNISLNFPMRISYSDYFELNEEEKDLYNKALKLKKLMSLDYIFLSDMLKKNYINSDNFQIILKLIEKKGFQSIKSD